MTPPIESSAPDGSEVATAAGTVHDAKGSGLEAVDLQPLAAAASTGVVGASAGGTRWIAPVGSTPPDAVFRIASLTKAVTAVTTVRAAGRRDFALERPVLELLPDLRADWHADPNLSISDLLSHTSGLASQVTASVIASLGDDEGVLLEAARLIVRAGSARTRGERWEYYNGNYMLAGAIIERLTERSFESAVGDLVLRPWDLATTTFSSPLNLVSGTEDGRALDATDYPRGRRPSGGLCSTVGDILLFAERVMEDTDLLASLERVRVTGSDGLRYGLAWAIGPSGQLFINGRLPGYRSALLLLPRRRLAGVVLAADSAALPAAATILSDLQRDITGDDLVEWIIGFAA